MKNLLLLIPSTSYRADYFLQAAERLNLNVVVACDQHQTLEKTVSGKLLTLDFHNLEQSTEKVLSFAEQYPIAAVVPTEEEATLLAVALSKALSLPHNQMDAVAATRDKHLLRERLIAAGIPTPSFQIYSCVNTFEETTPEINYPLVLKPTFLSGSQGVIRANNPDEFQSAWLRIKKLLETPDMVRRGGTAADKILVESYIPGKEFALEGLLQGGRLKTLAIFDKPDPLEGPFFEETLYMTPSRLSSKHQKELINCTQKGTNALGLTEGPIHAELRLNDQGSFIIEIAARSIGGRCSRILQFQTGYALEEIILRHVLNVPIPSLERAQEAAGVMMIPIPSEGRLIAVDDIEKAKAVSGITDIEITLRRNQEVIPLPEGRSYLGFIFARGKTAEGVETALRTAQRQLSIQIRQRL